LLCDRIFAKLRETMAKIDPDKMIDTNAAAEHLGVSRMRVVQLIGEGRLPAVKVGRDWLIYPVDLKLVKDRKVGRPRKEAANKKRAAVFKSGKSGKK
jgi:excisionase family DNA binding protein